MTYKYIKFKYKVYLYFPLCFISLAICSFIIQKAIFEQTEGLVLRNAQRNHSHFKMAQILFFYFFLWFHIGILIFNIHGIYCVMSWDKNLIYFQVVNYWVWCSLSYSCVTNYWISMVSDYVRLAESGHVLATNMKIWLRTGEFCSPKRAT